MKSFAKILFGFNLISLRHLISLKPQRFFDACARAYSSAQKSVPHTLTQIPEISLGDILGDRKPVIRFSVMRVEDGMLPSDQAMALLSILVAEAPNEILEIGTYMGHTTRQIAENLGTATIHTVDLPEDFSTERDSEQNIPKDDFHIISRRVVGREFKGQACANRIKQHFSDTGIWDFHNAGHSTFFFIDGSHTYEYCKNDSEKCFELCGGHGVFLWHDVDEHHPGVVRFISEWRSLGRDIKRISGTPLAYWKNI